MINRKIEYFVTLAECLSFTQTAVKHGVSQTAISQFIATLEERVGVRLFERTQHTVSLTEAGKYYYAHVKKELREYDDVLVRVKAMSEAYQGYIRVGIGMYEYCSTESFFSDFLACHPDIKLDILQYPYSVLTEKLRTGELDVIIGDALCENAFGETELRVRTLFSSPNYLVADQSVIARCGSSNPADILRRECLITNCESDGPSSLHMLHKLLVDEVGFLPDTISQTNSINTQLMLVRAKHGVAIVPGFVYQAQGSGLTALDLPSHREIKYELLQMKNTANPAVNLLFSFQQK